MQLSFPRKGSSNKPTFSVVMDENLRGEIDCYKLYWLTSSFHNCSTITDEHYAVNKTVFFNYTFSFPPHASPTNCNKLPRPDTYRLSGTMLRVLCMQAVLPELYSLLAWSFNNRSTRQCWCMSWSNSLAEIANTIPPNIVVRDGWAWQEKIPLFPVCLWLTG